MGQETRLMTTIRFAGETFKHKGDVERSIELCDNIISNARETLVNLAYMTEPAKFCGKEDPAYWIKSNLNNALEDIIEYQHKKTRLEILLDTWDDCHTIEDIGFDIPDEVKHKSFIEGDYVPTIKYPKADKELY